MVYTGRRSLHVQKHTCANCGYPSAGIRKCTSSPSTIREDRMRRCDQEYHTNALLQSTGARRPRGERPPAPAACARSSPSRVASRTASRRVLPRAPAALPPSPHKPDHDDLELSMDKRAWRFGQWLETTASERRKACCEMKSKRISLVAEEM